MPTELMLWMLSAIVSEPQDDLREMYSQTVRRTLAANIANALGPLEIQRLFSLLGASTDLRERSPGFLRPNKSIRDAYLEADWRYLISIVKTLIGLVQHLTIQARSTMITLMCRMALDSILMSDLQVALTVENAISHLLDLPLNDPTTANFLIDLHENLYTSIQDPVLQAQLIKHILPTSDSSSRFRVRLAHSFLVQAFPPLNLFAHVAIDLVNLATHLNNPRYDIVQNMKLTGSATRADDYDYGALASWAALLNIAVDDGIGPSAKLDSRHLARSSPTFFNAQVDKLADRIRDISKSIRDTGASYMKRTEAKGALDILYFRLIYAIRTKPRPRKVMFGEAMAERETERGKDFMESYFVKAD